MLGTVSGTVTEEGVSVSAGEFFTKGNQGRNWPLTCGLAVVDFLRLVLGGLSIA